MSSGSPGRNDPCPCGSGRKYKACCLAADRERRPAGAASLSTVEGGGGAAGAKDVWQAELVPHPAAVENDPDGRITVALVVSPTRGPLWAEVHRSPRGDPQVVAGLLSDAVLAAAKKTGRLPGRLEARHTDVVRALADRLRDRSVEVVARQRLDRLDGLAGAMVAGDAVAADMAYPRPCVSIPETWRAWSLPEEILAALFAAGAEFHRSEAWEMLDDEARLELETPDGRVWAFSVLGGAGIETGLAMYSDPSDLGRILSASSPLPVQEFVGRCLAFTFDPANVIPPPMRREVLLAGWEVAAPDAYPMLHTINTPGGGVSEADARDLATALRAVETGCDRLGGAYLLGEAMEWRDAGTGATVRLAEAPRRRRPGGREWLSPAPSSVHRVLLTLEHVEPPIWRRIELPSDMPLRWLHRVIQDTMGWADCHLYAFDVDGVEYGEADEDGWLDYEDPGVSVGEVAPRPGARIGYVYDFGDHWSHELVVEAVEAPEPGTRYPRCLDGARQCPVEDCGGPGGYAEILEAFRNPDSERARELVEWVGRDFDPEDFDIDLVNRLLGRLQAPLSKQLAPGCAARFGEVSEVLGDLALDDDVPVLLVNTATSLLYDYAMSDPRSFLAARKLEVLAAAALHASGMMLDTRWGDWRPTLEELADRFGVSTAAIATRSRAMRDLLPTSDEFEVLLVEAILREVAATADREGDGGPPGA